MKKFNPIPERVDSVNLFIFQLQADAAIGLAAQNRLDAEEDGVVEYHELRSVTQSEMTSIRYTR